LIKNQWYALLESKQVKKGKVFGVIRMGEKLVFWRTKDSKVHCMIDKCIHRGVQLSKGKIIHDHLQCPFHGFEYDGSGKVRMIPAKGKNARIQDYFKQIAYPTKELGGLIFIFWGDWPEDKSNLPPVPMFEELLGKKFKHYTKRRHWNVHYSLVIENQLDTAHIPFVHTNTIGRGFKTLVHGPGLNECQDKGIYEIQVKPYNVKDDGKTIPLKPNEVPNDLKTYLYFRFPNIWMNRISDNVIVFIAFAPVDEENTLLYLRFYYKKRFLRSIIGRFGAWGNLVIAGQDKRVVTTIQPKKSWHRMEGQKLIQADRPIVQYRRIRDQMMSNNGK